jgi:hypothetical protein
MSAGPNDLDDIVCYGFIIPLPQGKDTTIETFENSKVRNMINDLLREKIEVYWLSDNLTVLSKKINKDGNSINHFFKRGAFIVPFTGNKYDDILIISVIWDYSKLCEINMDEIKINSYCLLEPFNFYGYKLNEVKIAQHIGIPTRYGWPCYVLIADQGGFLTFDFLDDFETSKELNNVDYNVFMWPYEPNPATLSEIILSLSDVDGLNSIRSFVSNGGGYIGSCYGAEIASAGFLWPLPVLLLRRAYNPDLKTFSFFPLALSDTWMRRSPIGNELFVSESKLDNYCNPLSFGLNNTFEEFFDGGWYKWIGEKSESIASYEDIKYINRDDNVPDYLRESIIQTPSHVSSSFGRGKIVQFTSHPEFVINISILFDGIEWNGDKYYGMRIIFNALNYVTSEKNCYVQIEKSYTISFINTIINLTNDLLINENNKSEFENIIRNVTIQKENIDFLRNKIIVIKGLFSELDNNSEIFQKGKRHLGYVLHYSDIYDNFLNNTISNLDKIQLVYPMYKRFNASISKKIILLKDYLTENLNNSLKIMKTVLIIVTSLENILNKKFKNIFEKLRLIIFRRNLISTYELNLKYIPQLSFNSLKILRNIWYNYEANVAVTNTSIFKY